MKYHFSDMGAYRQNEMPFQGHGDLQAEWNAVSRTWRFTGKMRFNFNFSDRRIYTFLNFMSSAWHGFSSRSFLFLTRLSSFHLVFFSLSFIYIYVGHFESDAASWRHFRGYASSLSLTSRSDPFAANDISSLLSPHLRWRVPKSSHVYPSVCLFVDNGRKNKTRIEWSVYVRTLVHLSSIYLSFRPSIHH